MNEEFSKYDPKVVKIIRAKAKELATMNLGSFDSMNKNYRFIRNHLSKELERTVMDNLDHHDEIVRLSMMYAYLANDLLGEHLRNKKEL